MRTILKVIAAIILLLVIAMAALPFVIDPNDYKDEISAQVEKTTGRTLTLQGDIELSVFPWIALELGPMTLSNAKGFEADYFAEVEKAKVRIRLLPLLKKELEMDTIVLNGLVLNLEKDAESRTNWDDLATADGDEAQSADEQAQQTGAPDEAKPALEVINIAGIQFSNANIFWSDKSTDQNFQLRNMSLNTDQLNPGQPTDFETAFDLISGNPEVKAHVTLQSQIMVNMDKQQYALEDLDFNIMAESTELPFDQAELALQANVAADMAQQQLSIQGLQVNINASKGEQNLQASLNGELQSQLASQEHQLSKFSLTGTITDPALPAGEADFRVNSDIQADLNNETLSLADLAVQIEDMMINGQLDASAIMSDNPTYQGNIQVNPFSLRKLANDMDIELPPMADENTLETVEMSTSLKGSSNDLRLSDLQLTLDQSQLTGSVGIEDFSKLALRFDLNLDEIDADRYLPPATENEQESAPQSDSKNGNNGGDAGNFPLEPLRDINAKGTLKIGKLKASGITSRNIVITIDAENGLIRLNPLQANMYEGEYRGKVTVDAREDSLKLSMDENLSGIKAGPLLDDLTGEGKISGTVNANARLTGQGKNVSGIKETLSGDGGFEFKDGALKGINIAQTIRNAQARLKGQQPQTDGPQETDFSALKGSFTADNGLVENTDLELTSPLLRVTGNGTADLVSEAIDYALRVAIVGSLEGQGGQALQELKGVTIPLKIGGTFSDPKPSVDLQNLIKGQASDELKSKAREKLREKLGNDAAGLLGGAANKDESEEDAPAESTEADTKTDSEKSAEDQLKEDVKKRLKGLF